MTGEPVPPPPPPYDFTRLLALYARAALVLRNPVPGADRFRSAARVLCEFFRVLQADDAFWAEVERVVGEQPDIRRLFEALEDFEDQEYQLLIRAGIDELAAAELAADLRIKLEQYQPGSLLAVQGVRNAVSRIGHAICAAENDLDDRQRERDDGRRRRRGLKLLSRAFGVAAAIVAVAVNIPAVATAVGVGSVIGGVLQVAQVAADFFTDPKDDR